MNLTSSNPVLLVHGIYDTVSKFKRMSAYLTNLDWSVHSLNLTPNNGDGHLEKLAHQVADYIVDNFPRQQFIDLVGFSMGGLVTRYYLQRLGGMDRVQRYINISTPNNGTLTAYSLQRPAILQMRPNSAFIRNLNQDLERLEQINLTVMWTPFDLMIVPANSSRISVGKEIQFPVPLHAWMIEDSRVISAVASALSEPIIRS